MDGSQVSGNAGPQQQQPTLFDEVVSRKLMTLSGLVTQHEMSLEIAQEVTQRLQKQIEEANKRIAELEADLAEARRGDLAEAAD